MIKAVMKPNAGTSRRESTENITVGSWWMYDGENEKWLGCVTHVGSNYAALRGIQWSTRVHFDKFDEHCTPVADPDAIIKERIEFHQREVHALMDKVHALTAKLAVHPKGALAPTAAPEAQAIAVRLTDTSYASYKKALIKAEQEQLPKLFHQIQDANKSMAQWMKAKLLPLEAQAKALETVTDSIKDRVFQVELYAGLTEQIVCIKEGAPAPNDEKARLLQRRCYMDEECLARYETGGMEFRDIEAFDAWLTRKDNLERLLPFPRTVVAFQVRRDAKWREAVQISDYFSIDIKKRADESTYCHAGRYFVPHCRAHAGQWLVLALAGLRKPSRQKPGCDSTGHDHRHP